MKTPINRKVLKQHLLYNSWKYILLAIVACFGWNLIFTMTAYRSPDNKIVNVSVYGAVDVEGLQQYMDGLKPEFPDMEKLEAVAVTSDATYGTMVLMARLAANEVDIVVLPRANFQSYAAEGYFVPLEQDEQVMAQVNAAGFNLERTVYRNSETGEKHTYGIPLSLLPGLSERVMIPSGEHVVSVMVNNGNEENVMKMLCCIIRDLQVPSSAEMPQQ